MAKYPIFNFDNSKVLITGASRGIGRYISKEISGFGADLILCSRDISKANLSFLREQPVLYPIDLSIQSDITKLATYLKDTEVVLDHLVLCHGMFAQDQLSHPDLDLAENIIKTNYLSFYQLITELMQAKRILNGGSIVVISSVLSERGAINASLYSSTKGAISAMVKSMSLDLARHRIRINSVSPAHIDTSMLDAIDNWDNLKEQVEKSYPLGRIGQPRDVSSAVLFLLSDASDWITGADIKIDGGKSCLI